MSQIKTNLKLLKQINVELSEKFLNNHISSISVINSTDVLMQCSFNNKERIFLSLNHASPFISPIPYNINYPTIKGGFSENLRSLIKTAAITDISLINNDRVLQLTLQRTNEFFEKVKLFLILELIPTKANLIILNNNREILYAYHYTDITKAHPIVKGMKYEEYPPKELLEEEEIDINEFKKSALEYIDLAEDKRKKESLKPLYTYLVGKKKSLTKKIAVLNKEIRVAKSKAIYKEYGEMIFSYLYDEEELKKYIEDNLKDTYDPLLDYVANANKYFKLYKKSKKTIEMNEVEIEKASIALKEVEITLNVFYLLDEDEIKELYHKYLPQKARNLKHSKVDARLPYFVKVEGVTIGYGKNTKQNEYLSFKKASKNDLFFHIKDFHGCHVIVFNEHPNNEVILVASEIALILSGKSEGNIQYTPVSQIKRGHNPGEALLDSYKEITLREVRESTHHLLKHGERFSN